MHYNSTALSLIITALLSLVSVSTFADTNNQALSQTNKIKLYTAMGSHMPQPFNYPVDVSLVINNELIITQNMPGIGESSYWSYVEVDKKFNFQEITEAKFTWLNRGKKYLCVAKDLPLYVQEGNYKVGTLIEFICN